jgi:hypothetical protein
MMVVLKIAFAREPSFQQRPMPARHCDSVGRMTSTHSNIVKKLADSSSRSVRNLKYGDGANAIDESTYPGWMDGG